MADEQFAVKGRCRGNDVFVMQLSGGGRLLVGNDKKQFWADSNELHDMKAVPSLFGDTRSKEVCEEIIANIST